MSTYKPVNPSEKQVRTETDREKQPRARKLFGVPSAKLAVTPIPGYHLRWINDENSQVQVAQEGGYEFVAKDETGVIAGVVSNDGNLGDRICRLVGTKQGGGPLYAYLMKVPEEYYLEAKAELAKIADKKDHSIRMGTAGMQGSDSFYVPGHTPIKMGVKTSKY